jgi:hypothetical protein
MNILSRLVERQCSRLVFQRHQIRLSAVLTEVHCDFPPFVQDNERHDPSLVNSYLCTIPPSCHSMLLHDVRITLSHSMLLHDQGITLIPWCYMTSETLYLLCWFQPSWIRSSGLSRFWISSHFLDGLYPSIYLFIYMHYLCPFFTGSINFIPDLDYSSTLHFVSIDTSVRLHVSFPNLLTG